MNYRDISFKPRKLVKKVFDVTKHHRVCKVDSFMAQPFNRSAFGWSRNSVSAMAAAVNYSEFLAIAQQIAKTPAQFNLPDKCSLKDALAVCRPRFAQSPYELDLFAKQLADNDMERLNEEYLNNVSSTSQQGVKSVIDDSSQPNSSGNEK